MWEFHYADDCSSYHPQLAVDLLRVLKLKRCSFVQQLIQSAKKKINLDETQKVLLTSFKPESGEIYDRFMCFVHWVFVTGKFQPAIPDKTFFDAKGIGVCLDEIDELGG